MAGLYIHIPFCRTKCAYCDFFSMPLKSARSRMPDVMERYCAALLEEFRLRRNEIAEPFTTIYIGGGTPTALPAELLESLLRSIIAMCGEFNAGLRGEVNADLGGEVNAEHVGRKHGGAQCIGEFREVTIEANPEDITIENLQRLTDAGMNRISIGIQAFDPGQLTAIERLHSRETSIKALETLRDSKINYSADLIYGLPGQTVDDWARQLAMLLDFKPPHFSSYLLSYEPGTRLYARREKGIIKEADESTACRMYEILSEMAHSRSYHHYEISNFALPGYEAIHNSSYWNLTPYLGLGVSAHSFDGTIRRYNPANFKQYLDKLGNGFLPSVTDEETEINRINDYIITSLRTDKGLSLPLVAERWGEHHLQSLLRNASRLTTTNSLINARNSSLSNSASLINTDDSKVTNSASLINTGDSLIIPEDKWLKADAILRDLLLD